MSGIASSSTNALGIIYTGSTVASDIAVAWARSGATLVVSAYLEAPQLPAPKRDGIFREIGEIASEMADLN